jgi:hypothetical protein
MPELWRRRGLDLMYPLESVLRGTGGGMERMVVRRENENGGWDVPVEGVRPMISRKVVLGIESVREGIANVRASLWLKAAKGRGEFSPEHNRQK